VFVRGAAYGFLDPEARGVEANFAARYDVADMAAVARRAAQLPPERGAAAARFFALAVASVCAMRAPVDLHLLHRGPDGAAHEAAVFAALRRKAAAEAPLPPLPAEDEEPQPTEEAPKPQDQAQPQEPEPEAPPTVEETTTTAEPQAQ
jgi:hypothetical protein